MNLKVFLLIFALSIFLSKYPPIFTDISHISVKSKYQYIHNYRYFVPWLQLINWDHIALKQGDSFITFLLKEMGSYNGNWYFF